MRKNSFYALLLVLFLFVGLLSTAGCRGGDSAAMKKELADAKKTMETQKADFDKKLADSQAALDKAPPTAAQPWLRRISVKRPDIRFHCSFSACCCPTKRPSSMRSLRAGTSSSFI